MLEELFGGGRNSPPANNNTNTQPTTSPSSPPASEPEAGTTEPVEDETAEDDMPVDHDDGTYSPSPVTDENTSQEVGGEAPADETTASDPVGSPEETDEAAPPTAGAPEDSDEPEEADDESDNATPSPVATSPSQPAPSSGDTFAPEQPQAAVEDTAAAPGTAATRGDPVTRITDLIASYEKLLSEPETDANDEARTRAMELAQNRVLTSLIDNLSASDARLSLLDDSGEEAKVSLINRYYAEAGR